MPTTCTIQLTGIKYNTGLTVLQELLYNPALVPAGQSFAMATFPTSFTNLVEVDVQVVSAAVDTALVVVTFDNNDYTAYL